MSDLIEFKEKKDIGEVSFIKEVQTQTKIAKMSHDEFGLGLKKAISLITPYLELKKEIEAHHAMDIKKMLLIRFKHLSLQEIVKAFENERYGVYEKKSEHYQSFTSEYVSEVLIKYQNWKLEKRKINNLHQKKIIEMTQIEKDRFTIQAITRQLTYFMQNRLVDKSRVYVYDIFDKAGLMPKDLEYKNSVKKDALALLKKEYENKKALTKEEYKENKNILDQIIKKTNTDKVRLKCKELALEDFLRKELKKESDIERLIKKIKQ